MPSVKRKGRKTKGRLALAVTGDLTAPGALEFRDAMLKTLEGALPAAKEIELDLSGIGEIDLSGLQVILAVEAEAHSAGSRMEWRTSLPDPVRPIVESCGFMTPVPEHVPAGT